MTFRNLWLGLIINDSPSGVDLVGLAMIGADVVPADKPGYFHVILPDNWRIGHHIGDRRHFVRHRTTGRILEYDWQTRDQERPFIQKAHQEQGWEYHSTVRKLMPYAEEFDSCGRKRRSLNYRSYFSRYDYWSHDPREPYNPCMNPFTEEGKRPQVCVRIQESRPFLGGRMNLDPSQGVTGIWVTKQACPWAEGNVVQFWPIPGIADERKRTEDVRGYDRWMKTWFDEHYPNRCDPNAYWDDPELNKLDSFAERFHRHHAA